MATVPTIGNFRTSIQGSDARFQAPQGPSAGSIQGEQLQRQGQAIQGAGSQLARIAADEQNTANQVRVNDAMNQAMQAKLQATFDPQAGYVHLRGRAALERPDGKALDDEYGSNLEGQINAIRDSLGNDRQKQVFQQQAQQLLTQFRGGVQQHVAKEFGEFTLGVQKGTIETAQNQMGLAWGDPDAVLQGRNAIKAAVYESGRLMGQPGAVIEAAMVDGLSRGHLAVVAGALQAGKIDYAREYAKQVDAELSNEARLKIQGSLETDGARQQAQSFADDAMARGLSLPDALKEARTKFAGKDEDEAVREIGQRFTEMDVAKRIEKVAVVGAAWAAAIDTGRLPALLVQDLRSKDAVSEEVAIRNFLEAKYRRAKADADGVKTEGFDTFYGLVRLAQDEPARFADMDLRKVAPLVGKEQIGHLVRLQTGISKGDAKAMEEAQMVKSTLGLIKGEVAAIGIDLSPKDGTSKAQETALFLGALSQSLMQAAQAKGSPLTTEESKRIGMNMVREGVEQGSGIFGIGQTTRRGYQIATDPNIKPGASFIVAPFDKIPADVRNSIVAEYRAAKGLGTRPLNSSQEAEIERAYTRGVQQGRFK